MYANLAFVCTWNVETALCKDEDDARQRKFRNAYQHAQPGRSVKQSKQLYGDRAYASTTVIADGNSIGQGASVYGDEVFLTPHICNTKRNATRIQGLNLPRHALGMMRAWRGASDYCSMPAAFPLDV